MKNLLVKFSVDSHEVETVTTAKEPAVVKKRIDEEGLFGLFTANIIKIKKKFIR